MLALRLVIDTNVIVSAAPKSDGLQRTTFLLAITKPGRLYVSTPILEEYAEVLSRPELAIRRGLRLQLLQLIKNHAHLVTPSRRLPRHRQPQAFPGILEKYQDREPARICQPCRTASHSLIGLTAQDRTEDIDGSPAWERLR